MRGQIRALDAEFWLGLRDARRLVGNLYLGYETAKYYWEHYADNVGSWRDLPSCSSLTKCVCGADEARAAVLGTQFYGKPLHVMAPAHRNGRVGELAFHGCREHYARDSFVRVAPGVFVASPELSFVQVAQKESFAKTLLYGYALCGTFALDETRKSGLAERERLTSVRRLEGYVGRCGDLRGIKRAREAVRYVREGSASPRESKLSMMLTLPLCHGGKGFPAAKLNKRIDIPNRFAWLGGRNYYVADLFWEGARVTAEYDSDLEHTNKVSIYRDSDKRNTLMDMGYSPLCFTSIQLDDPEAFDHAVEALRRKLGVRRPARLPRQYQAKVDELRCELGLSEFSFAPRYAANEDPLDFAW